MAKVDLIMPKMGESIMEGTVTKWLKKQGDTIALDESILEIGTDKVDSEVPSPAAGRLAKILVEEGKTVAVGTVIAYIETDASASLESYGGAVPSTRDSAPKSSPENGRTSATESAKVYRETEIVSETTSVKKLSKPASGRFYSPLVSSIAQQEGISMSELEYIPGTGNEGRVTKRDILLYVQHRKESETVEVPRVESRELGTVERPAQILETKPQITPAVHAPKILVGENDEVIEMTRMRRIIAEHMVMSKHVAPHVTSVAEADVTNLVNWREHHKSEFEKRNGVKLTFTPLFVEVIVRALRDFPMVNASVDGDKIILRKNINIGMAVALGSSGLIVPVIKNADEKNLLGIAKAVNNLAEKARNSQLTPDDIEGGTFTLTNIGSFGSLLGTPIINQPQVAILGTGAIKKRPVVIESAQGDTIGIRSMMYVSLSYDHRLVDGALGGAFLSKVVEYLEGFDVNRAM